MDLYRKNTKISPSKFNVNMDISDIIYIVYSEETSYPASLTLHTDGEVQW